MSTFARLLNLAKGLVWNTEPGSEPEDPEAVFDAALLRMKRQHQRVQAAVGPLVYERNCLRAAVERKKKQRDALGEGGVEGAGARGTEPADLPAVEAELAALEKDLAQAEVVVTDCLGKLRQLEAQRKQLESRRGAVLAKLQSAQARKDFNDMVARMGAGVDDAALEGAERHLDVAEAEAELDAELGGHSDQVGKHADFQATLDARQGGGGGAARKVIGTRPAHGKSGIG